MRREPWADSREEAERSDGDKAKGQFCLQCGLIAPITRAFAMQYTRLGVW